MPNPNPAPRQATWSRNEPEVPQFGSIQPPAIMLLAGLRRASVGWHNKLTQALFSV
jgi:hypothetical protein